MKKLKGVMINGEWLGDGFIINQHFRTICDISPQIMSEFIKTTKEVGYKKSIEISSFDFINKDTIKIEFIKDKKELFSTNLTFEKNNNSLRLVSKQLNNPNNNSTKKQNEIQKVEQTSNEIKTQEIENTVTNDKYYSQEFPIESIIKEPEKTEETLKKEIDSIENMPLNLISNNTEEKYPNEVNLEDSSNNIAKEEVIEAFKEEEEKVIVEKISSNQKETTENPSSSLEKVASNTAEIQPNNMNPIHITVELQQPQTQQQPQFIPQPQYIPQPQIIQQPMPIIIPQQQVVENVKFIEQEKITNNNKLENDTKPKADKEKETTTLKEKVDGFAKKEIQKEESETSLAENLENNIEEKEIYQEKEPQEILSNINKTDLNKDILVEETKNIEEILGIQENTEEADATIVKEVANEDIFKEIEISESKENDITDSFDFASLDDTILEKKEESSIESLEEELLKLKEEIEEEKLEAELEELKNSITPEIQEEFEQYKEELSNIIPADQKPEEFMIQALLAEMMSLKEEISVLKAEAVKKITVEEFFGDKEKSVVKAEDADFKILSSNEKHNAAILDDDVFFAGEKLYKWGDTLYLKD